MNGISNDVIADYELNNHLGEIFAHPDALSGLEAIMRGAFPVFNHRYPFVSGKAKRQPTI
jgi:hypothetical protein